MHSPRIAYALFALSMIGCVQPIGDHNSNHRPDAGGSGYNFPDASVDTAPGELPRSCRDAQGRGITTDGVVHIDPDGSAGPLAEMDVYCDMTTSGGGWTLVWVAGFTNYPNFNSGNNAMIPRPTWGVPTNGTAVSTATPQAVDQPGAMDFALWKTQGTEVLVASTINHWIDCTAGTGSLVTLTQGTVTCQVVKAVAAQCTTTVPTHFYVYNTGPAFSRGGTNTNFYYLFDGSTGGNWPTHDPCGSNQTNQVRNVANPQTSIYVRTP